MNTLLKVGAAIIILSVVLVWMIVALLSLAFEGNRRS